MIELKLNENDVKLLASFVELFRDDRIGKKEQKNLTYTFLRALGYEDGLLDFVEAGNFEDIAEEIETEVEMETEEGFEGIAPLRNRVTDNKYICIIFPSLCRIFNN